MEMLLLEKQHQLLNVSLVKMKNAAPEEAALLLV
jgi:hypothetical protein